MPNIIPPGQSAIPGIIIGPGVITVAGDYYLASDLSVTAADLTNSAALHVTAAGVRINLNGKMIRGVGLDPNVVSYGILGQATNNLVVYDGQVGGVTGFWCGIWSNTPWTRIEQLVLSGNYYIGATFGQHTARAYYNIIERIAGTTNEAYAIGLLFHGPTLAGADWGCHFVGNQFRELYRQPGAAPSLVGEGIPIIISSSSGGGWAENNICKNSRLEVETIGIFAAGGPSETRRNTYVNFQRAIEAGGSALSPMVAERNVLYLDAPAAGFSTTGISSAYGSSEGNLIGRYDVPLGSAPQANNTIF